MEAIGLLVMLEARSGKEATRSHKAEETAKLSEMPS